MTTPNVNNAQKVNYASTTTKTEGIVKQDEHPNSINANPVNTRGVGTEVQSNTDFNVYGNDPANFVKFKGNDRSDAQNATLKTASEIKRAYMQFKRQFPDADVTLEPMPDPNACRKGREGFHTYMQQLAIWEDEAKIQLKLAAEDEMRNNFSGEAKSVETSPQPEQTEMQEVQDSPACETTVLPECTEASPAPQPQKAPKAKTSAPAAQPQNSPIPEASTPETSEDPSKTQNRKNKHDVEVTYRKELEANIPYERQGLEQERKEHLKPYYDTPFGKKYIDEMTE